MTEQPKLMPWTCIIWPEWYDDDDDHGYGWSGEAVDEADAVRQACHDCMVENDVDPDDPDGDSFLDPETIDVTDAHFNFEVLYRRLKDEALTLADCMDEALTQHIYDEDNGDEIPEDCGYTAAVAAVRAACEA